jgi:uncharacterized membrane protein
MVREAAGSGWQAWVGWLDGLQLPRLYLCWGGLSLLLLVWVTPPFQVPDEPQHYYRSFQLSEGHWRPVLQQGQAGAQLPLSLMALVEHFLGSREHHTDRHLLPQPWRATLQQLQRPLQEGERGFIEFTGGVLYPPLHYLPQALAMAAGRALDLGPLALLYAGRLANALAALLLCAAGLRLLPAGRAAVLLLALLPMTQYMMASLSPDALTMAGGFLLAGLLLRFAHDGRWDWGRCLGFLLAGLLLCWVKVVYLPLLAAGVALLASEGRWRVPAWRRAVAWQLLALLLVALAILAWQLGRPAGLTGGREGVDAAAQLAYLREHWLRPVRIALRSIQVQAIFLSDSTVGLLGWLTLKLPGWVTPLAAGALLLSLWGSAEPGRARLPMVMLCWSWLLGLVCVVAVEMALYVGWTPVGGYFVEGVQGRYFTPLLPLLAACLSARLAPARPAEALARAAQAGVLLAALLLTLAMHVTQVRAYELF